MVEVFDKDEVYQEQFTSFSPDYMKDPVDYYLMHNIQPKVYRYDVGIYPILNGVSIDGSPILFEKGDHLDIKYNISRHGVCTFSNYMKFLSEAYKSDSVNLDN